MPSVEHDSRLCASPEMEMEMVMVVMEMVTEMAMVIRY